MAATRIPDAGELREHLRLLEFRPVGGCPAVGDEGALRMGRAPRGQCSCPCSPATEAPTRWEWGERRKAWAKATPTARMAIFSNRGVGSREVEFILRKPSWPFGVETAILWDRQFCLPTAVTPLGAGHLKVTAAMVTPVECRGQARTGEETTEILFPAVVAERYMGHTQAEPMVQNYVELVLVTPKRIRLALGSLVHVGDDPAPYWVKIPHELDPWKNEYEIGRTVEP